MLTLSEGLHKNHLWAALPEFEQEALTPYLQAVQLKAGQVLCDSNEKISTLYFPTTAVISLLCLMEDGASAEVIAVGSEGVAGMPALTGGGTMPTRMAVSAPGYGYAIDAAQFKHAFEHQPQVRRIVLLYLQAMMTQIAQSAMCNRRHSVDEQLCRWLLMAHDRQAGDELSTTQQMIASTLGVRREGVTEAAGNIEDAGLILRRRGHIRVTDRAGLEERTCECYSVIKGEFQRLLPRSADTQAACGSERDSHAATAAHPMAAVQW